MAWLLVLAAAAPALGAVDSIETLVADSDAVVVASLVQVYKDPPTETPTYRPGRVRATLAVVESIRGAAPNPLPVVVSWPRVSEFGDWQRRGGRRLVFLVRRERTAWHPDDPSCPLALRDGEWTLWEPFPNQRPTHGPADAVALGFTMDFRALLTMEQACAAAREAAARGGNLDAWVTLPLPDDPSLRAEAAQLHDVLRVPVDARIERLAHRWAGNPAYAGQVIAALDHFPSDENAKVLERFLADNQFNRRGRPGKAMTWSYPYRARAARALQRWGRKVNEPALGGPREMYRPVGWSVHAGLVGAAALWLGARAVRRHKARGAAATPEGPRRRAPVASLTLAAVCLGLAWLSLSAETVHELTASIGDSRYWLSSYRGGLQMVRIRQWPQEMPLSYGRFDLRASPEDLWSEAAVFATSDERYAGFRRMLGTMWGDEGATYPYGSFTVPIPLLATPAGLVPLWRLAAEIRSRRLRRSRLLSGCCTACGYNLKSAGDRCPECGAARAPAPYPRGAVLDAPRG